MICQQLLPNMDTYNPPCQLVYYNGMAIVCKEACFTSLGAQSVTLRFTKHIRGRGAAVLCGFDSFDSYGRENALRGAAKPGGNSGI